MWVRCLLFSMLAFFGCAACGGSGAGVGSSGSGTGSSGSGGAAASLAGTWHGTWLSSRGVGGTLESTLTQSGGEVDGDVTFTGSPCFAGGHVSGTVDGRDFAATLSAGSIRVSFDGTVSSASVDGTYSVSEAGACTNDTGTFTLER
jgi:hypothetical protein